MPQARPSTAVRLLRPLASALFLGGAGALLGWIVGYGLMKVSHKPYPAGFENFISDACPAAGLIVGLFGGVFSGLMRRSRLGWQSRTLHGGLWLSSLLTLAYLARTLEAEKLIELQEPVLCWMLGFLPGCVVGALSILFRDERDPGADQSPS